MILFLFAASARAQPSTEPENPIKLISPQEETVVIGKKPIITCSIGIPFYPENLYVFIDGVDVTDILEITPAGFTYRPFQVLPADYHTLTVFLYTEEGEEIQKEFFFWTRHYEGLEEAYSSNEVTIVYEGLIDKSNDVVDVSDHMVEANLSSDNSIKKGEWAFHFNTNLRYLEQDLPVTFPNEKGVSLANYLFQAGYTGDTLQFLTEIGDVQVNETGYTVQSLARRGGKVSLSYKDTGVSAFAVKSEQLFGFNGGSGIGFEQEDHIIGGSLFTGLFSNRLRFRTIYVTGGEPGSSFGLFTTGGNREGDVLGFVLTADIIEQKLQLEGEVDFSEFDADTADGFPSETDNAYRIRTSGFAGNYSYEAYYEHIGKDYEVIGNLGLQKDREGFTILAGASYPIHVINLSFSLYNDNVEEDVLVPRVTSYQGAIDYAYNKFPRFPMGIGYQKSKLDSSMEPALTLPLETETDIISGRINYVEGKWNIGLQTSYSEENDRTDTGNDSTAATYSFSPTYYSQHFSVYPNFSFNSTHFAFSGVRTDTYTASLDIRGDFLQGKFTYGIAGTFNRIEANDKSIDLDTTSATARVDYLLGSNIMGFFNPSVGLRGLLNTTDDRVFVEKRDELAILLVLSNYSSFSF